MNWEEAYKSLERIEEIKDLIISLSPKSDIKNDLLIRLSKIRSDLLQQFARVVECSARQDIYADICEKMINRPEVMNHIFDKFLERY